MAHQDYVSRPKNKKSNPYKPKQEQNHAGSGLKLKFIALFTLIAVAAFGYFLWSIKDQQATNTTQKATSSQTKKTQKQSTIPEFTGEDYSFRDELLHKEVEGGEYQAAEEKEYGLYCIAYHSRQSAETLKAKIAFTGIIAQIRQRVRNGKTEHQVYIAPYPNKRAAEADKHKLRRNDIQCGIGKWN